MITYKETFQVVPYSTFMTVVMTDEINEARRELGLKLYDKSNWNRRTCGRVYVHRGRGNSKHHVYLFVNIPSHDKVTDLLDTILHESAHVTNEILNEAGVSYDYGNDEHFTYQLGFIFNKALNVMLEALKEITPIKETLKIHDKEV